MPRKHRDIRAALEKKGFIAEENRKHIHFVYVTLDGKTAAARTMLSHGSGNDDVGDNLLGQMAKQVGLSRVDFLQFIDCSLTREAFDEKIRPAEATPSTDGEEPITPI